MATWEPFYPLTRESNEFDDDRSLPDLYLPVPSHSLTNFKAMIAICQILQPLLHWSNGDEVLRSSEIDRLKERLRIWWDQLPVQLRMYNGVHRVPPSHTIALKFGLRTPLECTRLMNRCSCLYRTVVCLTWRLQHPGKDGTPSDIEIDAATTIIEIVHLQRQAFGVQSLLFIQAYSLFCATVIIFTSIEASGFLKTKSILLIGISGQRDQLFDGVGNSKGHD